MDEEALMAAYCAGDERAYEQLYARLGPKLHGFFMRSFSDLQVARDLMQTTLLKMHRARNQFKAGFRLRPWVFTIAARVRLDEFQRRRHLDQELTEDRLAALDDTQPPAGDAAETSADVAQRRDQVRAAIARLPESQRVIIHLHRFEELSFAQIATALGTTEGAAKLRAFRGYERLRKELRPLLSDTPAVTDDRPASGDAVTNDVQTTPGPTVKRQETAT